MTEQTLADVIVRLEAIEKKLVDKPSSGTIRITLGQGKNGRLIMKVVKSPDVSADRVEHGEIKPDRALAFYLPPIINEDELEFIEIEEEENTKDNKNVATPQIGERGDRAIAIAAGGAVAGGLIGQIPGAIIGGMAGALFGFFTLSKKPAPDLN